MDDRRNLENGFTLKSHYFAGTFAGLPLVFSIPPSLFSRSTSSSSSTIFSRAVDKDRDGPIRHNSLDSFGEHICIQLSSKNISQTLLAREISFPFEIAFFDSMLVLSHVV